MKRIDKIYNYILEKSKNFDRNTLINTKGFSAQEIGDELNILRNNVSKELNILCRDKKIIKLKNRPVLYFDRELFQEILNINLSDNIDEIDDINTILCGQELSISKDPSPFSYLIGYDTSLKNQIEQAKAALMYPPNGLHTLIIGSTGVGKSLFANIMYQYAQYIKKLDSDAPFVIFNCADYANTPQLLLSHIFGYIKGAFTGAEKETDGIVAKADGGILFLDEIHRLPPEGQEMVFYFMDTGTYNKLGETERKRKANVLLIGATTEDPSSSLLNTFIRRIPITIAIPSFNERQLEDQFKLTKFLIAKEAQRVNKPIKISSEAIRALIGSTSYGNVGQLKSNIQLACAKGFLNAINSNDILEISLSILPSNIKNGIVHFANHINNNNDAWNIIPNYLTINPTDTRTYIETDSYEPSFNIYDIIKDKSSALQEQGMNDEDIKNFITTDINLHLKQFYDRFKGDSHNRDGLLKIVDKSIVDFSEEIREIAEKELSRKLNEKFIYAMSLHLSSLLNRIKNKSASFSDDIDLDLSVNSNEYKVAKKIHSLIESKFKITIPTVEISYIALLLSSINETSSQRVGIVVAAHGTSTASSMVAVAKKLFDTDNIVAADMPLEKSPADMLENVTEKVKLVNEGKGCLLLVDMGSLNGFADVITQKTNILTKSIDMVSTPLVLEAARKCSLFDNDLLSVYSYLLTDFRGYNTESINTTANDTDDVIITICSTGNGAAIKLKELVENIIQDSSKNNIKVIPIGLKNLDESITQISKNKKIISLVGIKNPNMGIPFISIEKLINGSGEKILRNLIEGIPCSDTDLKDKEIVLETLCKQTLKETLTFLNPDKIYCLLEKFVSTLETSLDTKYENSMKLRIMLHIAYAIERMILKDGLVFKESIDTLNPERLAALKKANKTLKNSLSISLTDDEIYFMVDIIQEY
ncbi:sigma 54-interacting transcriptional regulator [uncultured Clostridium sp.]|uniref:sigma 54-interacting transcriptional regulator n=1 Tax=uncultured Clostridium sp. TaxID=59620 RepID=UPI0025FD874A|nr:sigma-54-dependent transcriptional regulator [uncultured Clostridium sp.]